MYNYTNQSAKISKEHWFYFLVGTPKHHDYHHLRPYSGGLTLGKIGGQRKNEIGALMSVHSSTHLSANVFTVAKTASEVSAPLTISTSFIIGGGFIKCIPITYRR